MFSSSTPVIALLKLALLAILLVHPSVVEVVVVAHPRIRNTLAGVYECLGSKASTFSRLSPSEQLDHYTLLLNVTSKYRGLPPHSGSSADKYRGKWVENHFIDTFIDQPFDNFGGMYPLFVQWSDYQLKHRRKHDYRDVSMFSELKKHLRTDVVYMTVSQANAGLLVFDHSLFAKNVLVLNAGGVGHVPIPLIMGHHDYVPIAGITSTTSTTTGSTTNKAVGAIGTVHYMDDNEGSHDSIDSTYSTSAIPSPRHSNLPLPVDIGFYGSMNHGTARLRLLASFQEAVSTYNRQHYQYNAKKNEERHEGVDRGAGRRLTQTGPHTNFTHSKSSSNSRNSRRRTSQQRSFSPKHSLLYRTARNQERWVELIANTTFNLVPRGHGRASFRLAEVIQIGRIPIYLYDDYPWIPYSSLVRTIASSTSHTVTAAAEDDEDDSNMNATPAGYFEEIGGIIVGRLSDIDSLVHRIASMSDAEIVHRLKRVQALRALYTYEGLMEQIRLFFSNPFGRSELAYLSSSTSSSSNSTSGSYRKNSTVTSMTTKSIYKNSYDRDRVVKGVKTVKAVKAVKGYLRCAPLEARPTVHDTLTESLLTNIL